MPMRRAGPVARSLVAVAALALALSTGTAHADAPRRGARALSPPQSLMIKANDLSELPSGIGKWEIVGCGITALVGWSIPPISGRPATGPCTTGQDRIFTSYVSFQQAVSDKTVVSGDTVIYDSEKWIYTPSNERSNRTKFEALAGRLADASHISIIYTPQGSPGPALDAQIKVVAKYATMIELQTQNSEGNPAKFKDQVQHDLSIINKGGRHVPVLVGFATDPNGQPAQVSKMTRSYQLVEGLVQGIQLNLARWRAPVGIGCAPSGCPQVGASFLHAIGVS
jgi:hypothetical protein